MSRIVNSSRSYITRLRAEECIDCCAELFEEWLPQHWAISERRWQSGRAVTARKHKWQSPFVNDSGDRKNIIAPYVHIEYGQIELRAPCELLGVRNAPGLGYHAVPKLLHHFGYHHSDERLILDQEYLPHLSSTSTSQCKSHNQ